MIVPYCLTAARKTTTANSGQKISISGTGANTALLVGTASTVIPGYVMYTATVPSLVRFGASGASSVATDKFDFYVPGNASVLLRVPRDGSNYIDIIAEPAANGSAYVSVLEWAVA